MLCFAKRHFPLDMVLVLETQWLRCIRDTFATIGKQHKCYSRCRLRRRHEKSKKKSEKQRFLACKHNLDASHWTPELRLNQTHIKTSFCWANAAQQAFILCTQQQKCILLGSNSNPIPYALQSMPLARKSGDWSVHHGCHLPETVPELKFTKTKVFCFCGSFSSQCFGWCRVAQHTRHRGNREAASGLFRTEWINIA